MHTSALHMYSIGIAVENKPTDSRFLNVTPIELISALDGELNFNPVEEVFKGVNDKGEPYEVSVTTENSISCEWLPLGTNRFTPPDIRRGEYIEIFRLGDSDQFYWRCMGLRDNLRRLETVIYVFNASPDLNAEGIDPETCYFMEINTHQGQVTLSTSKANGEKATYRAQFNGNEGKFVIEDDIGNYIFLDSVERILTLFNVDETEIRLDKTNLFINVPEDTTMDVGQNVLLTVGGNITTIVKGDVETRVEGSITTQVDQDWNFTCGQTVTMDITTSMSLNVPNLSMSTDTTNISATAGITLQSGGTSFSVTPSGLAGVG